MLGRGPLHSITTPSSYIKTWQGSICLKFNFNMGEATEGRNFDVNIVRAA
jgi:hypothetical protein